MTQPTDGDRVLFPILIVALGSVMLIVACAIDRPACATGYTLCLIVYVLALMARILREVTE